MSTPKYLTHTNHLNSANNNYSKRERRLLHNKRKDERESLRAQKLYVNGLSGLQNLGNTCYMNAALQCLTKVSCLAAYLIDDKLYERHFNIYNMENIKKKLALETIKKNKLSDTEPVSIYLEDIKKIHSLSITETLRNLIKGMWADNQKCVPDTFRKAISLAPGSIFTGYNQQDSQEVLSFILDRVHIECKTDVHIDYSLLPESVKELEDYLQEMEDKIKDYGPDKIFEDAKKLIGKRVKTHIKENYKDALILKASKNMQDHVRFNGFSFLTEIFCGQIVTTIICGECNFKSPKFDVYMGLISVEIPLGASDLSQCFTKFLEKEMLYGDNKYNCEICCHPTNATKIIEIYKCPPILIVQLKRFTQMGNGFSKNNQKISFPIKGFKPATILSPNDVYDLFAITCHKGGFGGGHYVAYALNPIDKKWYYYDDSQTEYIPYEDLESRILTNEAYILYYQCRVSLDTDTDTDTNTDDIEHF